MQETQQWKVVCRVEPNEGLLIAGPFTSMKEAQHWIDTHPDLGAGLSAAPIVLPQLQKMTR